MELLLGTRSTRRLIAFSPQHLRFSMLEISTYSLYYRGCALQNAIAGQARLPPTPMGRSRNLPQVNDLILTSMKARQTVMWNVVLGLVNTSICGSPFLLTFSQPLNGRRRGRGNCVYDCRASFTTECAIVSGTESLQCKEFYQHSICL